MPAAPPVQQAKKESLFGPDLPAAGSKASPAEKRLREELDAEIKKKSHKKKVPETQPSLQDLGD